MVKILCDVSEPYNKGCKDGEKKYREDPLLPGYGTNSLLVFLPVLICSGLVNRSGQGFDR